MECSGCCWWLAGGILMTFSQRWLITIILIFPPCIDCFWAAPGITQAHRRVVRGQGGSLARPSSTSSRHPHLGAPVAEAMVVCEILSGSGKGCWWCPETSAGCQGACDLLETGYGQDGTGETNVRGSTSGAVIGTARGRIAPEPKTRQQGGFLFRECGGGLEATGVGATDSSDTG